MRMSCLSMQTTEDSGAVVERRPLVPKVPGSNPVMSWFLPLGFVHTIDASTGYVSMKQTSSVINISLKLVSQSM